MVTSHRDRLVQFSCHLALILSLGTLFSVALCADDKKGVFTPKHVAKLSGVVAAEMAPDGSRIAYVKAVPRELLEEESGSSWTELHVLDTQGGGSSSRPFITGKQNVGGVAWTPDSQHISLLLKREGDKGHALYVISVAGGEARKVLEHATSISSYSWSPDGKHIAFLAQEEPDKKQEELAKKGFNQIVYEENAKPTRIWIASVDVEGKGEGDAEKARLVDVEGHASTLSWSPAGGQLLVALAPSSLVDDAYMEKKLHVIDVESGKIASSLGNPGKLGAAVWSPDGKHIAYITGEDKNDPKEGRLWVSPATGGSHVDALPNYMGHVAAILWRSANTIVFIGDEGAYTVVGEVGRDGKNRKTLLKAGEKIWGKMSLGRAGEQQHFALVGQTPRYPDEAFLWSPGVHEPKRLTNSNPWIDNLRLAKQEVVIHKAKDGLELQGILIRPLDEKPGQRYPLIMNVHGGPEAHIRNGWLTRYSYPGQVAAARGMAVFLPNYRGSTGRGVAYSKTSQADAAGKEFSDLIDAVDHLVSIGLVDKDKVGITGGSYGGYASAWGATYYSDRFAASVMFVGISDNISKVGTTDIPNEMYHVHHLKWLWDDWKYFLERSPIYHIQKARTPILILHGKDDPRVHPSQSLELYRHLKTLGKAPVRLVLYPGEGHGNRKSAARYDYNLRLLRWMEHYLKGPGGAVPPMKVDYDLEEKPKERLASRRRF